METWHIVLIVAAIALILYLVMRRNVLPAQVQAVAVSNPPAPGVSPTTGQVYSNPPSPPPMDVAAGYNSALNINNWGNAPTPQVPSNGSILQNIPIRPSAITNVATNAAFRVTDTVNNSLAHIPVVGKALSTPGKAVTSVTKKAYSALSSLNPF